MPSRNSPNWFAKLSGIIGEAEQRGNLIVITYWAVSHRFSWIRDSSFTLYALIRLGFTEEASAYTEFIFDRLQHKVCS